MDVRKYLEQLLKDAEGCEGCVVAELEPKIMKLVEALLCAPDPEREGYCSYCGSRLELVEIQKEGYVAHMFKHLPACWYGKVRAALAEFEGRGEGEGKGR